MLKCRSYNANHEVSWFELLMKTRACNLMYRGYAEINSIAKDKVGIEWNGIYSNIKRAFDIH